MGSVQGNIRLIYEKYLRRQTDSSRIYLNRKSVDAKISMTMVHHRMVPQLYNTARHDYNSNVIDKLKEGSVLWHIKAPFFRNHKYFKVKN